MNLPDILITQLVRAFGDAGPSDCRNCLLNFDGDSEVLSLNLLVYGGAFPKVGGLRNCVAVACQDSRPTAVVPDRLPHPSSATHAARRTAAAITAD